MNLTLLCLLILTIFSGYFSGSEIAFFSLSTTKIKVFQTDPDPKKRLIARLLHHPRDLLVTIYILNTLVNILIQNVSSHMFGEEAGWEWKVGVPLVITLVFGEIIPKYLSMCNNVFVASTTAPSLAFFDTLVAPLRRFTIAITAPISRFLFFFLRREKSISKEELQHALEASERQGVLNKEESQLVTKYLYFRENQIKELMCPKEDVVFFNTESPLIDLNKLFAKKKYTRIPICQQGFDSTVGVISAMQFLSNREAIHSLADLKKYSSKPFYIPETTSAKVLLKQFETKSEEFAIVVDEYGTPSGIVTKEDLLEGIIGKIRDQREGKKLYTRTGTDELIASGKLELSEFNDLFHTQLTSDTNMKTIGGWLIEKLGEIPKGGAQLKTDQFLFHVLSSQPNRIKRLYIRKI